MGVSTAENLAFLFLATSLLLLAFFPSPINSAPLCSGSFRRNIGDRRLRYPPPSPSPNTSVNQASSRALPISKQSAPPSPTTII